ncbi:hypothetical protein Pth03_39490 [Planotetraspora thailandica]|uniref:Secreted protein n=1 Tax=Planotetraspora thailandica TaxID=487172 RepID=A0A8J3VDC2_9ACTN|nr:hypothetical protein [Planotetraspora thailandica]GII55560.1 hypothetical protein Pth03_39490 [Planotetraspora thailandica]
MSILSRAALATTAIAAGIVTLTAVATPAFAYVDHLYHGNSWASFDSSTGRFTVCDNDNDGRRVYVFAKKLHGSETSHMYDPDSYGGGCGGGTIGHATSSDPWNIWEFCVDIPLWSDDCAASGLTY